MTKASIPSLDGLRALSILLVIVGHLRRTPGFGELDLGIGDYAHLGVLVFFVISGFLITTLLQEEFETRGTISLTGFYARRALRIFPPAYAYMTVIFVLWHFDAIRLTTSDAWHAVTYTVNFLPSPAHPIVHLWSLSVEEQFYLLWPLAIARLGPARATPVAAAVLLIAPIARIADRIWLTGTPYHALPMFPMVADSLAIGCLLACWRRTLESKGWYRRLFHPAPTIAMIVMTLVIHRYMNHTAGLVLGTSLINILLAVLVHRAMFLPNGITGRLLNSRPAVVLGTLSYSLYLWQELFLDRTGSGWMNTFPQSVVCAAAAAVASYVALERPLQALRKRIRS